MQDVNSHFLSGTDGSLTLPRLEFWHYRDGKGWHDELTEERTAQHLGDPYAEQTRHFRGVVEGEEEPICSAADAMRSLEATLAVATAAASGNPVGLAELSRVHGSRTRELPLPERTSGLDAASSNGNGEDGRIVLKNSLLRWV